MLDLHLLTYTLAGKKTAGTTLMMVPPLVQPANHTSKITHCNCCNFSLSSFSQEWQKFPAYIYTLQHRLSLKLVMPDKLDRLKILEDSDGHPSLKYVLKKGNT